MPNPSSSIHLFTDKKPCDGLPLLIIHANHPIIILISAISSDISTFWVWALGRRVLLYVLFHFSV